ncbi:MAG: hypothetical protein ACYC9Z_15855 [Casimicrobiaceae bacterium]
MKKLFALLLGTVTLISAGAALAQGPMGPAGAGRPGISQPGPIMDQMGERTKAMQALHEKMSSASTPEERRKIMEEGREELQKSMNMMQPMMQGGGMMGSGTMKPRGKAPGVAAEMQFMSKRMDMMQMMMQTMMDQQGMMPPPNGRDAVPAK